MIRNRKLNKIKMMIRMQWNTSSTRKPNSSKANLQQTTLKIKSRIRNRLRIPRTRPALMKINRWKTLKTRMNKRKMKAVCRRQKHKPRRKMPKKRGRRRKCAPSSSKKISMNKRKRWMQTSKTWWMSTNNSSRTRNHCSSNWKRTKWRLTKLHQPT